MSEEEVSRITKAAQRVRRSKSAVKVVVPTAAALGAGAAVAVGSIGGGSGGVLTGCANTVFPGTTDSLGAPVTSPYGSLRLIDPSLAPAVGRPQVPAAEYQCDTGSEAMVTWSQQGPTGPAGTNGLAGATGATGATGSRGAPGSNGADGAAGAAGAITLPGQTIFSAGGGGSEIFLKLEGISGEVTAKAHKDQIEISSFSLGASSSAANPGGSSSGAGAGKVSIASFSVVKTIDKSSPKLLADAANGANIGSADIYFAHQSKGTLANVVDYHFDKVMVQSIQQSASGAGVPSEDVTFRYQKAEETFLPAVQLKASPVSIPFDVVANKAM
jgi:type VI secretion system Hcp family effector